MFSLQKIFGAALVCGSALAIAASTGESQAASESVFYIFDRNGAHIPSGALVERSGVLFGETTVGTYGVVGTLFSVKSTDATSFTYLHSFHGVDGQNPEGGLIIDPAGVIYGNTTAGGSANAGTIFQLAPNGQFTSLYSFTGGANGAMPAGRLVRDSSGNLYGTAGGGDSNNDGVVFKLAPDGTYTVIHTFTGGSDGGGPFHTDLAMDGAGNLYGTTCRGGSGHGVVFKIAPGGTESVLYAFTGGRDGACPSGGVVLDENLNAYGTTYNGGTSQVGVAYKVTPGGTETVLYNFTGGTDGAHPLGGLTLGPNGNYLYGTTFSGGPTYCSTCGVAFAVPTAGGAQILLHDFGNITDGSQPTGDVLIYGKGRLFGTTASGGEGYGGVIFQITN